MVVITWIWTMGELREEEDREQVKWKTRRREFCKMYRLWRHWSKLFPRNNFTNLFLSTFLHKIMCMLEPVVEAERLADAPSSLSNIRHGFPLLFFSSSLSNTPPYSIQSTQRNWEKLWEEGKGGRRIEERRQIEGMGEEGRGGEGGQ